MSKTHQPDPSPQQDKLSSSNLGNVLNLINNIHYCGPCSMQFESENIFEKHVLHHKFVGLYKCFHCPALGPDTNSIQEHMAKQHPTKESYYGYLAYPGPFEVIDALKRMPGRPEPPDRMVAAKSSSAQATTGQTLSSKSPETSTVVSDKQLLVPADVGSGSKQPSLKLKSKNPLSEIENVVENFSKTILTDIQNDKSGNADAEQATERTLEDKESVKVDSYVKPQISDTIEISDNDDSDIEITGESRIPVPKLAGSLLSESTKQNNSYETKLQCAFINGQYVCKSCKLGSKYISQFATHVYSHLHNVRDGVHGCPYCPQGTDKVVAPIKCKLVVQLLGILEKQKAAQEACKQLGLTENTGTNLHQMTGNVAPITQPSASINVPSAFIQDSTTVSEAPTVSPSCSLNKLDRIEVAPTSLVLPPITQSTISGTLMPALVQGPTSVIEASTVSPSCSLNKQNNIVAKPASMELLIVHKGHHYQGTQQVPDVCGKQNVDISPITIAPIMIEPEEPVKMPVIGNSIPSSRQARVVARNELDMSTNNGGNPIAETQSISHSLRTNDGTVSTGRILSKDNLERASSPKPTVKVQDQKSGGKSIVRCYHDKDQFVCESCKYSVHHSKPKVFRKHLWFELHPTRDCNHCPESSQYNRFKCCPIINQLMLYLLDVKAKKQKKLAEEDHVEKSEVLSPEKQVDDSEKEAGKSGLASIEESSPLSEMARTQGKVGQPDQRMQITSPGILTLPASPTEPKSSELSQSTNDPIEINPAIPESSKDIGGSTNIVTHGQLESSTADVIKLIQGLNRDTDPIRDNERSYAASELIEWSELLPSEKQLDDPEKGPSRSGTAYIEEPNLLSELAITQSEGGNLDQMSQISSPKVSTSSQGLPPSHSEPQSIGLSESTKDPIGINPASPLSASTDIEGQLEISADDVIKMIQGLNNDTAPVVADQSSHTVSTAEPPLHIESIVHERAETKESGQSSYIPNSNIADDQHAEKEVDCTVLPSNSTGGCKAGDQNESTIGVINLSTEDETNGDDSQGTSDSTFERLDLCIWNVTGAAGSKEDINSANGGSANQKNEQTVGISEVDSNLVTPVSDDIQNTSGSLPQSLGVSIDNTQVGICHASTNEENSTALFNETSNTPDEISKTPKVDDLRSCMTDVTSQTRMDDVVRKQSNEAPKEKDSTRISRKDSSMESKQGDASALSKGRDSAERTSMNVNEDFVARTVQNEDIEIPNASKRNTAHQKQRSSENDGKDGLAVKRTASAPKCSVGISTKMDKPLSSSLSEKNPTGYAYTCSFFKCSLWVAQDAGSFKIHNQLHHADVKSFPCAFCSETLVNVEALIAHTEQTHTESKLLVVYRSYHCGFKDCWLACGKALDFLNHNQKVHANSKTYPCCYCKQGFRTLAELVLHIDESVTYSCTACPNVQKSTYTDIRKHVMNSSHGSKQFLATGEVDSEVKLNLKCLLSNETGVMKYKSIDRYIHVEKPVREGSSQETLQCTRCHLVSSDKASYEAHVIKCAKQVQQKDKISLLRSARPMVFKNNIKDSEAKSTEKTQHSSSSNDQGKDQAATASCGNAGVQGIDAESVGMRNPKTSDEAKPIDEDTADSSSKTTKSKNKDTAAASSSSKTTKSKNKGSSGETKKADIINKNTDKSTKISKPNKRKMENGQEQSQGKRKKLLSNPSNPIADKKEVSPVHVSEDDDDDDLPDVDPQSSPDVSPSLVTPSPGVTKDVLQSLGKGLSVSCEKCSFQTEFRVVKAIHERVHLHKQDQLKLLWCPHCSYSTNKLLHFKIHVQCHTEKTKIRLYNCGHCLLSSNKMDLIDDHHEDVHSDLELKSEVTRLTLEDLQCFECAATLGTEIEFLEHLEYKHSKTSIQKYLKDMYNIASLKIIEDEPERQQRKTKRNMNPSVPEVDCSATTSDHDQLEPEKRKDPEEDTSCIHHCDFCSFSTSQQADLMEHWTTHEGQTVSSLLSSDEEETVDTSIGERTDETPGTSNKNLKDSAYSNYNKDTLRLINDMILNLKHDKTNLGRTGSCPLCPFTSKVRNVIVKHLNFHKKTAYIKDGFQCGYCLYISEQESVIGKHVKRDHPNLPMKSKVIGDAKFKGINEQVTGDEPLYSSDRVSSLKEQKPQKDGVQDNRSEDSGITSPTGIMEDEHISTADTADDSPASNTDIEDISVNTKLRFSTRHLKQDKEEKSNATPDNVSSSSLEDYFVQDGKKLEYTEDIIHLLDDMILNVQHSERGNYTGTLNCPICPCTSPDKCALRMHLQSHKSQASITDGYRCSYCLYTSEKLFPITRHQSQLHPRLPKKRIRIGNPDKTKTVPKQKNLIADSQHQDEPGFNSDLPGFTISAVVGSDGSTAMVSMDNQNNLKPIQKNQEEDTTITMGVSSEMEEYCRSLYCTQDVEVNTFQCKKCTFSNNDAGKVYSHFCIHHQEYCPFQCGYCEYRSVAVVKIGQHCEVHHSGLPVKVSPVLAGSNSGIAMETNAPATYKDNHGIGDQSDGLSTYMIDCGDNAFMCSICGYEHSGRKGLKTHLLTSHLKDYPYKCQHCDFAATEAKQVDKHTKKYHPNNGQSTIRLKSGPSVVAVKEEPEPGTSSGQLLHAGESNQAKPPVRNESRQLFNHEHKFRCELCNYSTKWSVVDVKIHVLRRHLNLYTNNCRYCTFGSRLKTVLGAHYRSNHCGMPGDPSKDWDAVQEALTVREEGSAVYVDISEHADVVLMTYKPNKSVESVKAKPGVPAGSSAHTQGTQQEWQQGLVNSQPRPQVPLDISVKTSEGGVTVSGSMVVEQSMLAFTPVPGPLPIVIQPSEPATTYVLYECRACKSRYAEKELGQYHAMVHHLKMDPFMCSRCTFGSRVEREVIDHIEVEHPGEQRSVLPAYREHLLVQEYIAPVSVTAQAYQKAVGEQDNQSTKTIPCSMCHVKLPNSKALTDHMATEHVDYTGFTCCYCAIFIKAKPQMRIHFQTKHPDHKVQYKKVKDGIAYGRTLDSFPTATWMRNKNQNIGFANLAKRKLTAIRNYGTKEKKYSMPNQKKTCEASSGDGKAKPRSKFSQMKKQFEASGSTVELHCKHCNYITTNHQLMKDHVKRHMKYKPFKCGHCELAALKRKTIVAHSRRMHVNLTAVVTKVVDPAILASVTQHYRVEVKQGKQDITIPAASQSKTNSQPSMPPNRRTSGHQLGSNTGENRTDSELDETAQGEMFICVLCGEEMDNQSNLMQHIMLELNYRPWACPHCAFRDVTMFDVKQHCLRSHPALPPKVVNQRDEERMARIRSLVERSKVSVEEELALDASQQNVVDTERNPGLPIVSAALPVQEEKFKPFKCSYCNMTACNLSELSQHMGQDHPSMRQLNVFPLDEPAHQPPMMQPEYSYPLASQDSARENRVYRQPPVNPEAERRVIAQPEIEPNNFFPDSNQDRAEKLYHPMPGSKKKRCSSQGQSPKSIPENPDGYIGTYDGVIVTDAHLELESFGVYYCRKCTYFAPKDRAVGHYVRSHTTPRWRCPHCDFRSTAKAHVRRHCHKTHPDLPVDVVLLKTPDALTDANGSQECGVLEQVESDLSSSSDRSENLEPSNASQLKQTIPNLQNTSVEGSPKIGKFDGVAVTDKHLVKDDNDVYHCRQCTYSSERASAVGHYVRVHMPMRWKCPYCEVKCTITHEVKRHCRKMHPGLPVDVVLVDTNSTEESATATASVKSAKRTSMSSKPGPASSKKQKPNPTDVPSVFCCHLCTFKTDNTFKLIEHTKQHADVERTPKPQSEGKRVVPSHSATTQSPSSNLEEAQYDQSDINCPHCFYIAKSLDDLEDHNHEKHLYLRPFKCGYCDFSAFNKAMVRKHLRNRHKDMPESVLDQNEVAFVDTPRIIQ